MKKKVSLIVVLFIGAFLIGGIAIGDAVNYGIALGQHACLTTVQHSQDAGLINKVKQRALDLENKAQAWRIISFVVAVVCGMVIASLLSKQPEASGEELDEQDIKGLCG